MGPEAKVKKKITAYLRAEGIWYCMPNAGPYGQHGIPDILSCVDGKFLAIEVKAPGKETNVSANQERQLNSIAESNGVGIVASSLEQVAVTVEMMRGKAEG